MPARALRLYLVRHGQSEANLDNTVNARLPDHNVPLSAEGHKQAAAAGHVLARTLGPDRRVRLFVSPYVRTRETSAGIEAALGATGTRFDKREAIELRELEFGLFDGIPDGDLPRLFPREYEHYDKHRRFSGEFFAPMPLGESRCNVADRVKAVFGTILRDAAADRPDPITDFVIVSHGVTIRCFRLQWMHYGWEWYEQQRNPWNCSVQLIEGRPGGGYSDTLLFEGFRPSETRQTRREEGVVSAAP
ncbi:MAG: phosphoglycerate mutase family protein [Alphaproteobacteria bacterium]|nr:phosphoglycerate mutase family protein [Alphaproteobacteria bacterium]MBV9862098.1 phosphoglycerate mutase family protein [Alphaproteobacteria bacterium]